MEIEELKKEWQSIKTPQIDLDRLKDMIIEKTHPVLSGIRKQLIMELVGWSAFLIVCFTGLDADQKSMLANILLVLSVALPMMLNIYGFRFSRQLIEGSNISSSLQNRVDSLRRFVVATILFRIMLIAGVGYFFISSINIDLRRFLLLGVGAILLTFPLYFFVRTWIKRIDKLSETLELLTAHSYAFYLTMHSLS